MAMNLQVVGAGLPRTGTSSLRRALERLLGAPCLHMSALPGHPFDLGDGWARALASGSADWEQLVDGYVAAVDWPASMFWRGLSESNPEALVLLSVRDSAEIWWQSMDQTVLATARLALSPGWSEGRSLVALLERFAGTDRWDDPALLMAAYERSNAEVRRTIPRQRLLEWRAEQGWQPICDALHLPVPDVPFPWTNRRSEWG
jgi:hypothetical protein